MLVISPVSLSLPRSLFFLPFSIQPVVNKAREGQVSAFKAERTAKKKKKKKPTHMEITGILAQ